MQKFTAAAELRKQFLEYFQKNQHAIVPSSPLIPGNDPTLLFTNAGMVQFKDTFLGSEPRSYKRATSSQRCMRAGGKHNDLENVGYTARHHTFFEMLGNFSFGDYFKREAIRYAWGFLTEGLGLPPEKLWVTVFEEDDEAADIWLKEMKIDPTRFSRCGVKDNFWSMGDTGPCGPCTEIFYDHGAEIEGGPPGSPDADGDRYIEIWNLVFMQYERSANGEMTPLPAPSVDTGMGLERLAAVMQGVHNNYDTDLFLPIIKKVAELAKVNDLTITSLRVIADHIRACSFLISDGVIPSNEGRGYVLRRIIRRAARHGHKLGLNDPFFHKLVPVVVAEMGDAYPELRKVQAMIERILLQEEQQFAKTLAQGLKILEDAMSKLSGKLIPGSVAFRLYDTYGFPMDLTADVAREHGFHVDEEGFAEEMAQQRKLSQESSRFNLDYMFNIKGIKQSTDFVGYAQMEHPAHVVSLIQDGNPVEELKANQSGVVILDKTPFYAESGGQIGDRGKLVFAEGEFVVEDTRKEGLAYLHYGELRRGTLSVGDKVDAKVDTTKRIATALNHSATHLLNAALRQILGEHIQQKGSLVEAERLRFDFTHFEPLTVAQIQEIERLVNQQIRANNPVETQIMSTEQAMNSGAVALFGEKYGEEVRVLRMGEFSKELCGGTHVKRTGDIGLFKIITETGIAAGVRRIEAITGEYAFSWILNIENQVNESIASLKAGKDNWLTKLKQTIERNKSYEKQLQQLQSKLASAAGQDVTQNIQEIDGIKVLATVMENLDAKALREAADHLKDKLGRAVIVLASVTDGRANLIAVVNKQDSTKIHAGNLINYVAQQLGGKGGGRPDMAQAGANETEKLPEALASVYDWVKQTQSK